MKISKEGREYLLKVAQVTQPIFEKNKWHYELPNKSPSVDRIFAALVDLVEHINPDLPDDLVTLSGRFTIVCSEGFDLGFAVSLDIVDADDFLNNPKEGKEQ